MPLVSIVMLTYNRADTIQRAITSVRAAVLVQVRAHRRRRRIRRERFLPIPRTDQFAQVKSIQIDLRADCECRSSKNVGVVGSKRRADTHSYVAAPPASNARTVNEAI